MRCKRWAFECKRGCTTDCLCKDSYYPSNGTEGMHFTSQFCDHCIHDNPDPDKKPKCDILTAAMCFYPTDPEYPREWIEDANGRNPRCTKFVNWNWGTDGDPDDPDNPKRPPDPPDPRQLNLFPLYHPELLPQQYAQKV